MPICLPHAMPIWMYRIFSDFRCKPFFGLDPPGSPGKKETRYRKVFADTHNSKRVNN